MSFFFMDEEILTREKPVVLIPPIKVIFPRRKRTLVIPERPIVYTTADKTTCAECPCFPKEEPYSKTKIRLACQQTPPTLYELAAAVVDALSYPPAFAWTVQQVADWMEVVVGLPQYRECILDNHIDGMRLLRLEDPSHLPETNVHNFEHIQMITAKIRELYTTEFVKLVRCMSLAPREPLDHCTWFKSRTGPSWGIRQNWTRSNILRWMKVLMPEPVQLTHWDAVWYRKPEFPKVLIARVPQIEREIDTYYKPETGLHMPSDEVLVPRKFKILPHIPDDRQLIWIKKTPSFRTLIEEPIETIQRKKKQQKLEVTKFTIKEDSNLLPKKIITEGLRGKDLILARRRMPKPKFLA